MESQRFFFFFWEMGDGDGDAVDKYAGGTAMT